MTHRPSASNDRGSVDMSIDMMAGTILLLVALLVLFEAVAHWHARTVFDDAAADGARIAASFDGSCSAGVATPHAALARHAAGWAGDAQVTCERDDERNDVTIGVSGPTPGVLGSALQLRAAVAQSQPDERRGCCRP